MKFKSDVQIKRDSGGVFGYRVEIYPWRYDRLVRIQITKYRSFNNGSWRKADISWVSASAQSPLKSDRFVVALRKAVGFAFRLDSDVKEGNVITEKLIRQRLAYFTPR